MIQKECLRALQALYIALPEEIADDVNMKVKAALAEKDKEIERLKQESQENYKSYRAVAKEANEMEKEIERLKNMIDTSTWIQTEELKSLGKTINEYEREIEQLKDHVKLFNPCNHTGFESISCQICGYPRPDKYIASLKETITSLRAELKQQFEESISIIHDQGAENIMLKENLALNAKMLARQTDLAREAETEAAKMRNALGVVQANYDIYTTALVKFVVDEVLK